MFYYDRIDICDGNDVNKTSASKECDVLSLLVFIVLSFNQMSVIDVMIY